VSARFGIQAAQALVEEALLRGDVAARPAPHGGPTLAVLQPHADDAALSIGGFLRASRNDLQIVTVFSQSEDAAIREMEDQEYASSLSASRISAGLTESSRTDVQPKGRYDLTRNALRQVLDPEVTVIAPAGIGGHPDHVTLAAVAEELRVEVFWEDVAFWGIYAGSVEDRLEYTARNGDFLKRRAVVAVDITRVIREKVADLALFPSQSRDLWRPVRYAAAVALEHSLEGFCERLFASELGLEQLSQLWGGTKVRALDDVRYGLLDLRSYVIELQPC
jgi:LmbE family N-acetylglucosaminyl deacetylase